MFLYTWTHFVFICSQSLYTIYQFFIQSNLQTLLANKDCYPNKVHLTTLSQPQIEIRKCNTSVDITDCQGKGLEWADVPDYITLVLTNHL